MESVDVGHAMQNALDRLIHRRDHGRVFAELQDSFRQLLQGFLLIQAGLYLIRQLALECHHISPQLCKTG